MTVLMKKKKTKLCERVTTNGTFRVLKEKEFDSVVVKLMGGVAISLLAWESCVPEIEIRLYPDLLDEIANTWMEYRRGQAKDQQEAQPKRNRKKLLPGGVLPEA